MTSIHEIDIDYFVSKSYFLKMFSHSFYTCCVIFLYPFLDLSEKRFLWFIGYLYLFLQLEAISSPSIFNLYVDLPIWIFLIVLVHNRFQNSLILKVYDKFL